MPRAGTSAAADLVGLSAHPFAHRKDVDGLRAVAVTAVVLYHCDHSWLPGGFTGVDVFFVLSALAFHRTATANRQARKLRMRPARKQRIEDADDLAFEADVSEGFATDIEEEPSGLARIASWGFFAG